MDKRMHYNCRINMEVPQRESEASLARYLFHEHRVIYPEEDKGKLFNVTAELQFYNNSGGEDINWQLYFDTFQDLEDLIIALSNMKDHWEKKYRAEK